MDYGMRATGRNGSPCSPVVFTCPGRYMSCCGEQLRFAGVCYSLTSASSYTWPMCELKSHEVAILNHKSQVLDEPQNGSFVAQTFDWIELCSLVRRIVAEEDAHCCGEESADDDCRGGHLQLPMQGTFQQHRS